MSLQTVINSAQSIEINRQALVTTSLSRSGRMFTAARNWVKPWQFVVVPKPVMRITEARSVLEALMTADRYTEQTIQIGQGGSSWVTSYQGGVGTTGGVLNGITCTSTSGTSLVIAYTGLSNGTVIFKAGDVIQPTDHRYPYVVTADVTATGATGSATAVLNRGFLPQTDYTIAGKTIQVGTACSWRVKVSKLPTYRYISGQLVEFTSDIEFIESVI
jgi:hypothetical protein